MNAADSLLEARITGKTYRRPDGVAMEAVRELSLTLARGEFVCLIGPSGCGKTTTLRILCGLDHDFEGSLTPDPARLAIGIAFQEPRLLPWRTVEENIRIVLPPARRRADLSGLLATFGLAAHRARYPGELSLGLARRVSLARALAVEPDLLVLDEPFVSLDAQAAVELRRCVTLAAEGKRKGEGAGGRMGVLMVTHNVREALQLADRLVLLAPRPTFILEEVRLRVPRAARSPDWVETERAALAARFPVLSEV
ncbi:ABC transporter ATP-binding protein [Xanthobacter autotrophicus]|uniref:ABC transporter ATP-binding protein n=1 Tax=Xanthobacter autotrophicus TaxID=280 RepID=UPI0024A7622E|nr:ATP-binding cassette domain-containing protein [Xanthobacter autotrophicus]MDI4656883.1 ATP-binding cassette domain-containing protein [Xanthobacter autotrophicus]